MPDAVLQRARLAVIDTIACTIAGVEERVTRIAAERVRRDAAAPVASQLGAGLKSSPAAAAFVNGISGHALDFDDVSRSAIGHPSVVVLPAVLALGETTGTSGGAVLEAYVVGIEVMAKLGLAMGHEHYRRGWHATSTLGTLASALAAGKLLHLPVTCLENALAIAASQASGSRHNFGTMTKALHVGHANRCGVDAALLAADGLDGASGILEAPVGFYALFGFDHSLPSTAAANLGRPFDLVDPGLSVKKYPCCFAAHRAADGILELRQEYGLQPSVVRKITVSVPVGGLDPLAYRRPRTGLQGKFSMEYIAAAALLDGRLELSSFTDVMVLRPDAQDLMQRIEVTEDDRIPVRANPIEDGYVEVRAELANDQVLYRKVDRPRGSPSLPLTAEELDDKFRACTARVLGDEQSERALRRLHALDQEGDVRDVIDDLTIRERAAARLD